jgi:hypothetical protein
MKYLQKYISVFESKRTEQEGLNILNAATVENPGDVIAKIKAIDNSVNQVNIPIIASLYANGLTDLNNIKVGMDIYNDLLKRQRVTAVSLFKAPDKSVKLKIGDKLFDANPAGFIKFREYVDGKKPAVNSPVSKNAVIESDTDETPMWEGNNIFIYDGNDITKCIKYTQGSLTGKKYSFCIGQYGSGNMFNSYRDTKVSTFYFIVDKNRELSDPLHMVVFDHTEHGVELTDSSNTTGTIAEFGDDAQKYVDYLESKGVPVDKLLTNKPKTPEEIAEDELLREKNDDLDWFIRLPIELKSKYVGRGHILTDEQFDYLME